MKVAIVGSGISGLAVAHTLAGRAEISLFEAGSWYGGHTHTVDVTLPTASGAAVTHGVDTGFLVLNERTYPQLIALLHSLDVATAPSDMSFSVQVPDEFGGAGLEWSGSSLNTVFAQRSNLLRPRFLSMLRELLRFNALATRMAQEGEEERLAQPLGDFLLQHGFGDSFRDWYLLPMLGCIWSCPTEQMLQFPVSTLIRFCHNHGLLQVADRPQWWTVTGGARQYVSKIVARIGDKRLDTPVLRIERGAAGVRLLTRQGGWEAFDKVVIATHSDQALALLDDPGEQERQVLGAIRYQPNRAVLHTDRSVLPRRRLAWAAWNFERTRAAGGVAPGVCLHYLLNRLQPLPWQQEVIVSLNPLREIAPDKVLGSFDYAHPVFDQRSTAAQAALPLLQGRRNSYFCGAWTGYGFHEDGLKSGQQVARQLIVEIERSAARANRDFDTAPAAV